MPQAEWHEVHTWHYFLVGRVLSRGKRSNRFKENGKYLKKTRLEIWKVCPVSLLWWSAFSQTS